MTGTDKAYLPPGRERYMPLIDRVAAAGYEVLVVTVDVAVASNRAKLDRGQDSMLSAGTTPLLRAAKAGDAKAAAPAKGGDAKGGKK